MRALYTAIHVGDFELRATALRIVAPIFLGYGKNLHHTLSTAHLDDMKKLTNAERLHVSSAFSLSFKQMEGNMVGLDEIEDMCDSKECKVATSTADPAQLHKEARVMQFLSTYCQDFATQCWSDLTKERRILTNGGRTEALHNMVGILLRESLSFKIEIQSTSDKIIALDGVCGHGSPRGSHFCGRRNMREAVERGRVGNV